MMSRIPEVGSPPSKLLNSPESWVVPLSLIPALILLFANRFGAGVSPDSAGYILMADAMQSKGYVFADSTWWPPLLPLLLSVVHGLTQQHYSLVGHWTNVLSL